MFGAFKCCGVGARVLRNGTSPPLGHSVTSAASLDPLSGEINSASSSLLCCGNLNWSQRRFLRGYGGSGAGPRNINAQFVISEIENQIGGKQRSLSDEDMRYFDLDDNGNVDLAKDKELRKYSRSLRGHQSLILDLLPNFKEREGKLLSEISKIIVEDSTPKVRVKTRKEEALLKEWIGIQRELRIIRRERLVDYKKKLQIAGEQALREMETNLKKGMNLDDLDQAIEGALCSQAKAEYNQQKSSHDN